MRGHMWLNKVASVLGPLLRQWLTREAGWRYGIMATVPYEQQKLYTQNNNLINNRWHRVIILNRGSMFAFQ